MKDEHAQAEHERLFAAQHANDSAMPKDSVIKVDKGPSVVV